MKILIFLASMALFISCGDDEVGKGTCTAFEGVVAKDCIYDTTKSICDQLNADQQDGYTWKFNEGAICAPTIPDR